MTTVYSTRRIRVEKGIATIAEDSDPHGINTLMHHYPNFRWAVLIWCRADDAQIKKFDDMIRGAMDACVASKEFQLDLYRIGILRGGWIGLHAATGRYGFGLADYGSSVVARTVATHELFHLMRHVQGHARFETEARMRGVPLFKLMVREELFVWWKTSCVSPVGTAAVILLYSTMLISFLFLIAAFIQFAFWE